MEKFCLTVFIFALASCQPAPMHPNDPNQEDPAKIASWEVLRGDTINRMDFAGRKQGKWFRFKGGKIIDTSYYKDGVKISEK